MSRRRKLSPQTAIVLRALVSSTGHWRYGYDLIRETGIKSGSLYPILMRLTDEGLLESEWHQAERAGVPARHAYRLTPSGAAIVRAQLAETSRVASTPGHAPA